MDNEFIDQVDEDLNDNSHEPATKGDVRNLALRVELRFTKLESSIDQRFTKLESSIDQRFTKLESSIDQRFTKLESSIDQRFTTLESSIDQRFTTHDSSIKEYVYKLGWRFVGASVGATGVMLTLFAMFITSSLK